MDIYDCIDNGKIKQLHSCVTCGFVGSNPNAYRVHKQTYKHKYNMTGDPKYKTNNDFTCQICNFECKKHGDYTRHLDTMKHKINVGIEPPKPPKKKEKKIYLCKCGNKYKSRSGLWTHEKKCKLINNKLKVKEEIDPTNLKIIKMVKDIIDSKDEKIRNLEEKNKSLEETNKSLLMAMNGLTELLGKYK